MSLKGIVCPRCESPKITKHAIVDTIKIRIRCKDCKKTSTIIVPDEEIVEQAVRIAKQKQRFMDSNRIERKTFREYARVENAVAEYNKEMIRLLSQNSFSELTEFHEKHSKSAGIIHLSDLHLNELVNIKVNKFDFKIASQRLQKYIYLAKKIFNAFHVQNVLVAFTGDLLNSDKRLDKLLNEATNRSKATFLAVDILKSVLLDLNSEYNISVACVSGNESRIWDEVGWSEIVMTDNYDFTIFNMLKYLCLDSEGIQFITGDPTEIVVPVGGKNILLVHGEQKVLLSNTEKGIIQMVGKWSTRGVKIDYVIFGHLHYARIGDHFARSGSLVGANDYSDKDLQLITKASQNLHLITEGGQLHSVKLDLQDASDFEGYNFDSALEAYNPKSSQKLKKKTVTFEVVI